MADPINPNRLDKKEELKTHLNNRYELEKQITDLKYELKVEKSDFILNANWNQINEDRAEFELPKITNQAQRDAYMFEKFGSQEKELEELKFKLHCMNDYIAMLEGLL